MKFRNKRDVDDLRKKKLKRKFKFSNSYSSDDGKLILFENYCFVIIGPELTFFLCFKALNWWWIENFKCKKLILFKWNYLMNGELNGCLELFIVCIECVEIIFRDTNGVFLRLRNENLNA